MRPGKIWQSNLNFMSLLSLRLSEATLPRSGHCLQQQQLQQQLQLVLLLHFVALLLHSANLAAANNGACRLRLIGRSPWRIDVPANSSRFSATAKL